MSDLLALFNLGEICVLFRKGEIVKKVPEDQLVDELFALIEEL